MAGFADLAANLAELEGIPSRIAKEVADGIGALVADEFESGTDPYGRAWKALLPSTLKRKGGDSRILRRTDALSGSTLAKASSGAGVEIVSLEYGEKHQTGTKHMVARKILPDGSDLPEAWSEVIDIATQNAFKKALGK